MYLLINIQQKITKSCKIHWSKIKQSNLVYITLQSSSTFFDILFVHIVEKEN